MSSNRRVAFARVPRGTSSGVQPDTIQINKKFLDQITQARLAPDMATVLTKASAELSVTIQPNGKGNFGITSVGTTLGDSQDVQKVQALGSFINDERKAIVKSSVSALAKKTIAALVMVSREEAYEDDVPREIRTIGKAFVDVFRTIMSHSDMLGANVKLITQVQAAGDANERVRNHLLETAIRIRGAFARFLFYRAGLNEGEEARKLNDFLIEGKVLGWVFTRLCTQKLQLLGKDFEYRKLYFPKDATKGIQLAYREVVNSDLRENQGGILGAMGAFSGFWTREAVRLICGIPGEWDLQEFTESAKPLANVPILVVPFSGAVTIEEHFSILAQHGDRGLSWSVGNTTLPQDILKFLGTVPKRIAYGFIGRARFSAPWYENLFQGFRYDPQIMDRDGRSLFSQLQTQFRAGQINTDFFATLKSANGYNALRAILTPLTLAVMDIPPANELATALTQAIENGMLAIENGETVAEPDIWAAILSRREMSDDHCNSVLTGILTSSLDPKSKENKAPNIRSARSGLSPEGLRLKQELKRRGYIGLSVRVDQWLRSFLTTRLQSCVADVVLARLEASLATPIQFGKADHQIVIESTEFDVAEQHEDEEIVDDEEDSEVGEPAANPDDQ